MRRPQQGADALGRINLVAGDRQKIDAEFVDSRWNLANGLSGVGVKPDIVFVGNASAICDRLLTNNMAILGVDASTFDAMVLSHGHYDHFGGMVGFLKANKDKLKPQLPFYVGGEDCFCIRRNPGGQFGALDRKAILDADLSLMMAEVPALIADHAFTTGRIGQISLQSSLDLHQRINTILTSAFGAKCLGAEDETGHQVTRNNLIGAHAGALERPFVNELPNLSVEFELPWVACTRSSRHHAVRASCVQACT